MANFQTVPDLIRSVFAKRNLIMVAGQVATDAEKCGCAISALIARAVLDKLSEIGVKN